MLIEKLKENGIYSALKEIGCHVNEMFGGLNEESDKLYSEYRWVKSECHVEGVEMGYVINAIPNDFSNLAWEEWYRTGGKIVHHVLCATKWAQCTDETEIPADDNNHPDEICGNKWYYFEDVDIRPYFARN